MLATKAHYLKHRISVEGIGVSVRKFVVGVLQFAFADVIN